VIATGMPTGLATDVTLLVDLWGQDQHNSTIGA
jgi:hypothetical protein